MAETTVSKIVTMAHAKLGVIAQGREPSSQQMSDGITALASFYQRLINQGTCGPVASAIATTSTFTASENTHVHRSSDVTTSVLMPEFMTAASMLDGAPSDYYRDYGQCGIAEQRVPRDLAVIKLTDTLNGTTEDFIYDRARDQWHCVTTFTENDEAPLSHRDPAGLAACLAIMMADEYGQPIGPVTVEQATTYQLSLARKFSQAGRVEQPTQYF